MPALRFFALSLSLFAAINGYSANASALTEQQALERGMTRADIQMLMDSQARQARNRAAAAGRWDNPTVEYSRETLDLTTGESEERTWWLRQRFNIAGVKGLQRRAANKSLGAEQARIALEGREWRATIRRRFYQTLAAQSRVQTLERHQNRLGQIATMIEQRIARGESARYDGLRVNQELALIRGDFAQAWAEWQASRDQLFSLIGGEPQPLSGRLIPPPAGQTPADQVVANHPRLEALEAERDSAELTAKARRREVWPELTLGMGRKELDEPGVTVTGNVMSLGVELPLFKRGNNEARLAQSRASQRRADYALTAAQLASDLRAARLNLRAQRQAALDIRESLASDEISLIDIAESAYEAGEITLMELIDAYQTQLTSYQQSIERGLAARLTYIELQGLKGND